MRHEDTHDTRPNDPPGHRPPGAALDTCELRDLAVSDSGFVFDARTGATYSLNPSGVVLIRGMIAGFDRDALMDLLRFEFDVNGADLHRDIDEFVQLLRELGVVSPTFAVD